jgi:hypothetical protein
LGNELVPTPGPKPEAGQKSIEVAVEAAAGFIAASKADATRRAYASDWRDFAAWCADHGQNELPAAPATVAAYLSALASAGAKVSTIRRRCAAIADAHRRNGHDNPAAHAGVKATLAGIARTLARRRRRRPRSLRTCSPRCYEAFRRISRVCAIAH